MTEPLDLIVIGTGTAGSGPAFRCRRAGWRVAVVDELPYGGTCALRGCDPKKVLVGAAELADWHRRMQGRGVSGDAHISWPELLQFKRTFTDPVPADREKAFQKAGIATYHGPARFVSPERLSVDGQVLEARHFVVAAGGKPRHLGIPGEEFLLTSTAYLELDQLPSRIAFLGAGYISFEFAHISRRAGAHATIVGRGKPLRHFEQDLVTRLVDHTRSVGIELRLDTEVTGLEKRGGGYRLRLDAQGRGETIDADLVMAGDDAAAPGSLALTPVAGYEGAIVASNLLKGNARRPDYRGIPSVVFTVPPLAGVGLTESEAREQHVDVRVNIRDTSDWYSNRRVAET